MPKSQRTWPEVAAELNDALKQSKLLPFELSKKAGIDYYAARRALQDGVRNKTANAIALCGLFGIPLEELQKVQNPDDMLRQVLRDNWDGSSAHAELLARLIKSTSGFKVTERK